MCSVKKQRDLGHVELADYDAAPLFNRQTLRAVMSAACCCAPLTFHTNRVNQAQQSGFPRIVDALVSFMCFL